MTTAGAVAHPWLTASPLPLTDDGFVRVDSHLRVDKVEVGGRAVTRVVELDDEARELELARMLAGDEISASARAHARELLGSA